MPTNERTFLGQILDYISWYPWTLGFLSLVGGADLSLLVERPGCAVVTLQKVEDAVWLAEGRG